MQNLIREYVFLIIELRSYLVMLDRINYKIMIIYKKLTNQVTVDVTSDGGEIVRRSKNDCQIHKKYNFIYFYIST